MKKLLFSVIAIILFCNYAFSSPVEISPRLSDKMKGLNPLEYIRVFVVLESQVDVVTLGQQLTHNRATPQERAYTVITTLTEHAQNTQVDILNYLESQKSVGKVREIEPFWIVNMVVVEANIEVLTTLASRNDVAMMDIDSELKLDEPVQEGIAEQFKEGVENGIKAINAHKLWALGFRGQGTIVMGVDTGVQLEHPALNYKWRGNGRPWWQAWYDRDGTTSPSDCDNHGTHTVGTMCGRAGSDTIGIAIDAEWMAAKTICSSSHTSYSIAAWQWALNPDSNAGTVDDMPVAIGNSWWDPSITNECTSIYVAALNTMEAGGVGIVFSAGNSGPGASTITRPKNINTTIINAFSTGAVNGNQPFPYPIASFSSRGPSVCGGTGSLLIKPEVSAPGEDVRSANRNSGYMTMSGTSMACPHVVGAAALLKSVAPSMTGPEILELLYNTATDLGTPGEDNTYGMGVIDVWAAFQQIGIYPLNPFTLNSPASGISVTTVPGGTTPVSFTWDTSATGAHYNFIFGTSLPTRLVTLPSSTNSLTLTTGEIDSILASFGVQPGDSVTGQWDIWAYKVNPVDSLKSTNGPRTITFKRGIPQLSAFNLNSPPNNTTITTSVFNNSQVNFNWTKSGDGTTYRWKFGSPNISTVLLNVDAEFDSSYSFVNSGLDVILSGIGLDPGDSIVGQWAVWAYNGLDSIKSTQTYNITFKRQDKGDFLVMYDSTSSSGRTSRDSVINVLNQLNKTYDLFNRGGQTSTDAMTMRGYKGVILLGQGTSVLSTKQKDSVIAYLNSGGTTVATKSKLIIFSEDVGYQFGRNGSTYQDLNFINNYLGWDYVADRPGVSQQGLIGSYINSGLADSTIGSWPEVIKKHNQPGTSQHVLYLYRRHINGRCEWRTGSQNTESSN
ncbi:MAG: hypothetical protein B6D43_00060 [Ignavibacteriales bacterium UTCHB1]|nr:MAG: hypothetical protein B6D43_00060 [Ignavibacteriales bacterium UTCHB1]